MKGKSCYVCGKENLCKDEIGSTKKYLGRKASHFYCFECLADNLEVDVDYLIERIKEFKEQGCTLF